jgi:hypothetical protein
MAKEGWNFFGTGQLGGQVKERTRCMRADRCIFTLSNTRKRPLSDDVGIDVGSGGGGGDTIKEILKPKKLPG